MDKQAAGVAADQDFLRRVFHAMLRARLLENKLSSLYKAGKIVGGVYLGRGQEAVSATLGTALIPGRDFFAPLIRDLEQALTRELAHVLGHEG